MARPVERPARPKSATQAKARAKARKAKKPKVVRPPLRERLLNRLASIDLRPQTLAAKVPFVVLVIGSLGAGLGLTLWLSTAAAERSYQLGSARQRTELLQQQKEALERDVQEAQAAPALAEAARGLGMIPTRDTAHLVQDPAGNWVVVGTPKPAQGVPPPPLNSKLPDEQPTPPKAPPVNSVEVPSLVLPGNGAPLVPLAPGPDAMVRTPDGATTLGPQHIPVPDGPLPLPGAGPATTPGMPIAPGMPTRHPGWRPRRRSCPRSSSRPRYRPLRLRPRSSRPCRWPHRCPRRPRRPRPTSRACRITSCPPALSLVSSSVP